MGFLFRRIFVVNKKLKIMTVEFPVFAVLMAVLVVNTVLDHLFNWWFRKSVHGNNEEGFFCTMLYLVKIVALFVVCYLLLT